LFKEKILKMPNQLYAWSGPFIFLNYLHHHFLRQRTPSSPYPGQSDFDLKKIGIDKTYRK